MTARNPISRKKRDIIREHWNGIGIHISGRFCCFRVSLSLRTALMSETYSCFGCFIAPPDLYICIRVALFQSSRFQIASATRHLSDVVCNLAGCRIGDTKYAMHFAYQIFGSSLPYSINWVAYPVGPSRSDR